MSVRDWQRRMNAVGYQLAEDGGAGPQTYSAIFAYMGARDSSPILGRTAAEHFADYRIDGPLRLAHWLAQFGHESRGFTDFEENLSYSAERLVAVWPTRFPNVASAQPYARNPEKLANKVYGGRLGNTSPGDGWKYRGRGPQLTGKENYAVCGTRTGLDLVGNPDMASNPAHFVHIACDFWAQHSCNALADADDLKAVTRAINGGTIGLAERAALLDKAKRILG